MYSDTTLNASTITKMLSFSSSDATMKFDAESYAVGSYAVVTHVDAEENSDHTQEDTILTHVIETSSNNSTWLKLVETGADTGTFKGSIQVVASGGTLEFERIQATVGDTLKVTCVDEVNTTGSARELTVTASVVESVVPTPVVCEAVKMEVSPKALKLKIQKSRYVRVTLTGENNCPVEGEVVSAAVSKADKKIIKISSTEENTNSQGEATFKINALKKIGVARVKFEAGNLRVTLKVRVNQ